MNKLLDKCSGDGLFFFGLAIIGVCAITAWLGMSGYFERQRNQQIEALVRQGTEPIKAYCSMQGTMRSEVAVMCSQALDSK